MKDQDILRTVFPPIITDYFDFVDCKEDDASIHYWLDERKFLNPEDEKCGTIRPYGFTEAKTVQDFPIRGRSVFLHIRRRKWIDHAGGEIFSYTFNGLVESGTKLSPDFAAFLKEAD